MAAEIWDTDIYALLTATSTSIATSNNNNSTLALLQPSTPTNSLYTYTESALNSLSNSLSSLKSTIRIHAASMDPYILTTTGAVLVGGTLLTKYVLFPSSNRRKKDHQDGHSNSDDDDESLEKQKKKEKRARKKRKQMLDREITLYPPGLYNTGNTCFVNSVLQGLSSLPPLISYLKARIDQHHQSLLQQCSDPDTQDILLTETLSELLKTLNELSSKHRTFTPTTILQNLTAEGQKKSYAFQQQDAHELFQLISQHLSNEAPHVSLKPVPLFDVASLFKEDTRQSRTITSASTLPNKSDSKTKSMNANGNSNANSSPSPSTPLRSPFQGLLGSYLGCSVCGHTTPIRHFIIGNLSLTPPPISSASIDALLQHYMKPDIIDDYICSKCTLASHLSTTTTTKPTTKSTSKSTSKSKDKTKETDTTTTTKLLTSLKHDTDPTLPKHIPRVKTQHLKCTFLANCPQVLTLHISRSVVSPMGYISRNPVFVEVPTRLSLNSKMGIQSVPTKYWKQLSVAKEINKEEEGAQEYELSSVIMHYGNHDSGHFTCLRSSHRRILEPSIHTESESVEVVKKCWWRISDESVNFLGYGDDAVQSVLDSEGRNVYLVFYTKK